MNTKTPKTALAALIATGLILTGCAEPASATPPPATPTTTESAAPETPEAPAPIRIAVIGDSITSWNPPYLGDPGQSWVTTATSDAMPLVGGWALPGAPIADMEANLTYAPADVFVIMAGTNDLQIKLPTKVTKKVTVKVKKTIKVKRHGKWVKKKVTRKVKKNVTTTVMKTVKQGTPVAARLAALDRMAAKMHAEHTVILATPPFGYDWALGAQWNAQLKAYAADRGFEFVDPWVNLRTGNSWTPGTVRPDKVHPTPASAAIAGAVIRDAITGIVQGEEVP